MVILKDPPFYSEQWTVTIDCIYCQAQLLVDEKDIVVSERECGPDHQSSMKTVYIWNCPCCIEENFINEDIIPKIVKVRLEK